MSTSDYFAATYAAARDKFLLAARDSAARLTAYTMPDRRGPGDDPLSVDVAVLGPDKPGAVLLLISGTHGVEGLCGSGCQVGFFVDRLYEALPPGTASVVVHALNPYGFAWLRRVNEDNVDLNRNFQDFSKPLPPSAAYEEVHDWLVPEDWEGPARQKADASLQQYIASRGLRAFQAAVSSGQYTRPTGLFYGGRQEVWSNTTFRQVLRDHIPATAKVVAALDFHTGLGPVAYGEPIYIGPTVDGFERAKKWYGPEVTSTAEDTSTSAAVTGSLSDAFRDLASRAQVTHLTLEYGTRPILEVLTALRGDHWLHAVPERRTAWREEIRNRIRNAFYVDTPWWKAAVYGRAADFVMRTSRGLASA
jgi:predicted deacylase